MLKRRMRNGRMTKAAYFKAATDLVAWFRVSHSQVNDLDFTDRGVFSNARELAERHDLDLAALINLIVG